MTNETEHRPCSITACPLPSIEIEEAISEHWRFQVSYCAEHAREIRKGVPVGPVGLDPTRIVIEPLGTAEPQPSGLMPGPA